MGFILGALLLAYLVVVLARAFARANPASMKLLAQRIFGLAIMAGAIGSALHGQVALSLALGVFALWCMGRGLSLASFRSGASQRTGKSRMRSAMIEMEIDHSTHAVTGSVLAGKYEGQGLDDLSRADCLQLHSDCLHQDAGGARLLEAYLDRRFAGWRIAGKGQSNPRRGGGLQSRPGAMSHEEAYEILGLRQGAGREDIVRAHRALMKKWHPDHGGSTDLAARVNEAKEVLMRRHL